MKTRYILFAVAAIIAIASSCHHDNPVRPEPPVVTDSNEPDSVVIELYEGHDHLKRGTQPDEGQVYWSDRNGGFHANPPSVDFPMRTYQKMVYERQADGSYKISPKYETVFRMSSSPEKNGGWYGFVVKLYGKDGKRLDLDYKNAENRNFTQVFYKVKNIRPIEQTIPANLVAKDTLFNINDFDMEDSDEAEIRQKLIDKGLTGDLTIGFEPSSVYSSETPVSKVFYFWYYDRPEDDSKELLTTPVGFRGVIAGRVPYLSYDVTMQVVAGCAKDGERNSVSPSPEQESKVVLSLDIPFRNVFEVKGWSTPTGNPDILGIVYDEEYKYLAEPADKVFENRLMFIPILREYPQYTVEQLREWYESDSDISRELGNFWL